MSTTEHHGSAGPTRSRQRHRHPLPRARARASRSCCCTAASSPPIRSGAACRSRMRSHMDTLAEHFRVIAPDTRGCGRTEHSGGADQLRPARRRRRRPDRCTRTRAAADRRLQRGRDHRDRPRNPAPRRGPSDRQPRRLRRVRSRGADDRDDAPDPRRQPRRDRARPGRRRTRVRGLGADAGDVRADEARPGQRSGRGTLADIPAPLLGPLHPASRLHATTTSQRSPFRR